VSHFPLRSGTGSGSPAIPGIKTIHAVDDPMAL
jgi:hypothetical protein